MPSCAAKQVTRPVRNREASLAEPQLVWVPETTIVSRSGAMAERTSARKASGTPVIRFEAQVQTTGGSTIVRLPDDASAKLPSRGQVAVKGVMNGHAFQTVLEPDGRRGHWLKVDKKLR